MSKVSLLECVMSVVYHRSSSMWVPMCHCVKSEGEDSPPRSNSSIVLSSDKVIVVGLAEKKDPGFYPRTKVYPFYRIMTTITTL